MDPDERIAFCSKGRRITPMRVAGLAFENVIRFVHLYGIWGLSNDIVRTVDFGSVSLDRADGPRGVVTFLVADRYKEALLLAGEDVAVELHNSGFVIIGTIVDEPGSTQHDMVLDYRRRPRRGGKYSGELKFYTAPANYRSARAKCFPLFQVACDRDPMWLGQLIIVVEVSSTGSFVRSRGELLPRDARESPQLLWGWEEILLRDQSVETVAERHRRRMHEAATLWGDARQAAITTALAEGRSALESGDEVRIADWLATCVILLTPPRRANCHADSDEEADAVAARDQSEQERHVSLQPAMRALVIRMLRALDVAHNRAWLGEPVAHLQAVLRKLSLDRAAHARDWLAIQSAMCVAVPENPMAGQVAKRARGSSSGLDETRRMEKLACLGQAGTWRRCPDCGSFGGRYVLSDDAEEGNRKLQCWTPSCKHGRARKTWHTYSAMATEEVEYIMDLLS